MKRTNTHPPTQPVSQEKEKGEGIEPDLDDRWAKSIHLLSIPHMGPAPSFFIVFRVLTLRDSLPVSSLSSSSSSAFAY